MFLQKLHVMPCRENSTYLFILKKNVTQKTDPGPFLYFLASDPPTHHGGHRFVFGGPLVCGLSIVAHVRHPVVSPAAVHNNLSHCPHSHCTHSHCPHSSAASSSAASSSLPSPVRSIAEVKYSRSVELVSTRTGTHTTPKPDNRSRYSLHLQPAAPLDLRHRAIRLRHRAILP
jgi:hypothetical protein